MTSYGAQWRYLRRHLRRTAVAHGLPVVHLSQEPDAVRITTQAGWTDTFDLLLLADGGASELRGYVDAGVNREFAGYILWRGVGPAQVLASPQLALREQFLVASRDGHHFVAYSIPAHDGRVCAAERLINWGWYHPCEPSRLPDLQKHTRRLEPHVLLRDAAPPACFSDLVAQSASGWPPWARHIIERTMDGGALAPHPVFELSARRLVAERLALVGDAAHLASPITGSGARMAFADAVVLGDCLRAASTLSEALRAYEQSRLGGSTGIIAQGRAFGAALRS